MALTKKIRFEVFKRDGFRCQYCGKTPPDVTLEVDHIKPKSRKGSDDINNLTTACFDCNRGKSNILLDNIPNTLKINLEILKEKERQLKEYNKEIATVERRIQRDIQKIEDLFNTYFDKLSFADSFRNNSAKKFLNYLPVQEIFEAMNIACNKIDDPHKAIKYFCGICWQKIKKQ